MDLNTHALAISNALVDFWDKNFSSKNHILELMQLANKQTISTLKLVKRTNLVFEDLGLKTYGETNPGAPIYTISINESLLSANDLHHLLATLFHELRHVYQTQIQFNLPSLNLSKITSNPYYGSIIHYDTSKIGISPYYFYYTSKIEHDAREFSYECLEKIISILQTMPLSKTTQAKSENFIKKCKQYIHKERLKYNKLKKRIDNKQNKLTKKYQSIDKKMSKIVSTEKNTALVNYILGKKLESAINYAQQLSLLEYMIEYEDARLASILINGPKNLTHYIQINTEDALELSRYDNPRAIVQIDFREDEYNYEDYSNTEDQTK